MGRCEVCEGSDYCTVPTSSTTATTTPPTTTTHYSQPLNSFATPSLSPTDYLIPSPTHPQTHTNNTHVGKMSWQAYVDQSLVGTGNLDKAAIFNNEGNSVWAATQGFTVSPQEMQEVVTAYKDPGTDGVKQVQSTGLHIAGDRFVVLKADERSIYGKKGREGVVIVKTTQAILVTHYPETVQPGAAANTVEQLADYLIKVGY